MLLSSKFLLYSFSISSFLYIFAMFLTIQAAISVILTLPSSNIHTLLSVFLSVLTLQSIPHPSNGAILSSPPSISIFPDLSVIRVVPSIRPFSLPFLSHTMSSFSFPPARSESSISPASSCSQ